MKFNSEKLKIKIQYITIGFKDEDSFNDKDLEYKRLEDIINILKDINETIEEEINENKLNKLKKNNKKNELLIEEKDINLLNELLININKLNEFIKNKEIKIIKI